MLSVKRSVLKEIQTILNQNSSGIETHLSEAEQILCHVCQQKTAHPLRRSELYLQIEEPCSIEGREQAHLLAKKRMEGTPLQHLLGYQYFLDHRYEVSPDVLIPRQETEILCQTICDYFEKKKISPKQGIEIGLGSGMISIELLNKFPSLKMTSSEISIPAQEIAMKNALSVLGKDRLVDLSIQTPHHPLQVFFPEFTQNSPADFLVSNPPYLIQKDEIDQEVIRHEPALALFAPENDPLFFYEEIGKNARFYLKGQAPIFLEVPHERAELIKALFIDNGFQAELIVDLTERMRVMIAQ